ncbi:hypothetical protein RA224_09435 [Achromobacter aegrifaciens]|uniref:hypothetical protein n=1 Tax=Achromobacter aegrifaciens TaxID=1287736 RepID=UPI0027B9023D|nr:hypothetical protein [Achromobacter aegrifaciens]WLW63624.1 hypothetical protein RA224_09435 [Achromobacter aegrifaciens]
MFLPSTRGKGRAWLALLFTLLLPAASQASTGNHADVQLQTDINTMIVRVDQSAPLPPGGCAPGYSWHTTYGGCRIGLSQMEQAFCPAGFTGYQVRYRNYYVLQANASDVVYEGWSAWQDHCTATRADGVVDTVIAKVRGNENGDTGVVGSLPMSANIRAAMAVNYGTMYGVTVYRPAAELICVYSSGTTASSGSGASTSQIWSGRILDPGTPKYGGGSGTSVGHCLLSNGNRTAELYGSCDFTSGGDGDHCMPRTTVVNITAASGCTVSTQTINKATGQLIDVGNYGICN